MNSPSLLLVPALLCSLFASTQAIAASPDEAPEATADAVPVEPTEAVVVAPAEAPLAEPLELEPQPIDDDYYEEPYDHQPYEPYEPEPERRTTLKLDSGYFGLGIAPGMTLHRRGFHPNTRFEIEFGGTLEHRYRDLGLSFGVVTHITPYYNRKTPSFGADVTSTVMLGPIYIRTGLGALGELPRGHMLRNTAPAIGGVIGAGLNFGREPMVRVGVDYDFRLNTRLEPVHTVFLAVRIACCRKD